MDRKQKRIPQPEEFKYEFNVWDWSQLSQIGKVIGHQDPHRVLENFNTKLLQHEYQAGLTPEQIASNRNRGSTIEF